MSRTLLFGGSFDPVHTGHLITAQLALEALSADRVILVPAHQNPHKLERAAAPPADRLEMLRRAIVALPHFVLCDRELHRPGPSYTIDTVEALLPIYGPLTLLMGQDQLPRLHSWHRIADLLQSVDIAVLPRPTPLPSAEKAATLRPHAGESDWMEALDPSIASRFRGTLLRTPQIALSSTLMRARAAAGLPLEHFVPEAVAEYIREKKLYRAGSGR